MLRLKSTCDIRKSQFSDSLPQEHRMPLDLQQTVSSASIEAKRLEKSEFQGTKRSISFQKTDEEDFFYSPCSSVGHINEMFRSHSDSDNIDMSDESSDVDNSTILLRYYPPAPLEELHLRHDVDEDI